jgi:hypothetical protein
MTCEMHHCVLHGIQRIVRVSKRDLGHAICPPLDILQKSFEFSHRAQSSLLTLAGP